MRVPRELLRETISVEDYSGSGARGPVYAAARSMRASMQERRRFVSDRRQMTAVTVDTLAIIRPEDGPVRPESRVSWNGETFRVESCYPMPDSRRPSHFELALTRYAE